MAKTKPTPVEEVKQIVLTQEQFDTLTEIRDSLDTISEVLNGIDGDENLFEMGKQVGNATSEIINSFNSLDEIIDELDVDSYDVEFESEDEDEDEDEKY
jgi:DNA repair ATPase RecN